MTKDGKKVLGYRSAWGEAELWRTALAHFAPDIEFRAWPDFGDPAEIDAVLCWRPPAGWLASLPHLRLVHSLGAGVDHILCDPDYPRSVPLVRLIDLGMTVAMTQFVACQVLRLHLGDLDYRAAQAAGAWTPLPPPPVRRSVGILGLGTLGLASARALQALGFDVSGWSRSAKAPAGLRCRHGREGLREFLAETEILVCLLPLTPETQGILDAAAFAALPRGAAVINVGRGGHVVEPDLLAALDSGHLSAAVLDVFAREPLAADHPFWRHPRVVVTPHIAAHTNPETAAAVIAGNLARLGEAAPHWAAQVDLGAGY